MGSTARHLYEPDYVVPPGDTLRDTIDALGMSQVELAQRMELSVKHINQIIQGVAPITPETALALERVTRVPARLWNNLEGNYQVRVARQRERGDLKAELQWLTKLPVRELIKRGKIEASKDEIFLLESTLSFFGVASRNAWEALWLRPDASFRKSKAFRSDPYALASWLRLGEIEAAEIPCEPFDRVQFKRVLLEIRTLTCESDPDVFVPRLVELCASAGVAVVFVPEIKGSRASGAARWLNPNKALIQLSLRYKSDDHLWFSFFHEVAHLLFHSKKATFIHDGEQKRDSLEEEADAFAANFLIPRQHEPVLPALKSHPAIRAFANQIGISPGIVVGRLQNDGILLRSQGNRLKSWYKFSGEQS